MATTPTTPSNDATQQLVELARERGVPELCEAITKVPLGLPRPIEDGAPTLFSNGSARYHERSWSGGLSRHEA
jgi:hypothetical protein